MDLISVIVILAFVGILAFWYYLGSSKSAKSDQEVDLGSVKPEPVAKTETVKQTKPTAKKASVKKSVVESTDKLPTKSKLAAMKKTELETFGKQFGIDLDRRKTKDNMIKDLQKHVKTK